jgi:hypothetical protein
MVGTLGVGEADGRIQDELSLSIGFPRGIDLEAEAEFDGGLDSRIGNETLRRIHAETFLMHRLPRVLLLHVGVRPVNLDSDSSWGGSPLRAFRRMALCPLGSGKLCHTSALAARHPHR